MRNILLISNKLYHYRVPIYNYFWNEFRKIGYNFILLTDELQENYDHNFEFECIVEKPNYEKYKNIIREKDPAAVIVFLHLKDWIMWPVMHWLKRQNIPMLYWNHGVNLMEPDNIWKNVLYKYLHNLSDAIVLYSPTEKKYISKKNQQKIFIGYNTLNFNEFPVIEEDKATLKKEFDIKFEKVVIYAARNDSRRRLDWLFRVFEELKGSEIGLLITGKKELTIEQKEIVDGNPNIQFLGEVYDQVAFNKLVKLSDVFSIPGRSGLAINQALYWGVPYVTTNVKQSPEIWYLKDGYNGFIADKDSFEEFKYKLLSILKDEKLQKKLSENAKASMQDEGNISNMFAGFQSAIASVVHTKIE